MNSNFFYNDSRNYSFAPRYNNTNINNTLSYSNNYGNTITNLKYAPEPTLKSIYNSTRINNGPIYNLNNSATQIRHANTLDKNMIERNRFRLTSSGILVASKKSKKFNKILKNGSKIRNIDINNESEDVQNKDEDLVSNKSMHSNKSFNNQTKNFSKSNSKNNYNNNNLNTLNEKTPKFNGSQSEKNITNIKPKKRELKLNPFARFINSILEVFIPDINKDYYDYYDNQPKPTLSTIDQNKMTENASGNSGTPNKFSQNTVSTDETNDELAPTIKNFNTFDKQDDINKKTIENNSTYNTIKSITINKNSDESSKKSNNNLKLKIDPKLDKSSKNKENQSNNIQKKSKKDEDDKTSKKTESKTSTNKFPFQDLSIINSQQRMNNNINQNDNYLVTHLGEYIQKETNVRKMTGEDLRSNNSERGFRFCGDLTQAGTNAMGLTKTDQDISLVSISVGGIVGFNLFGILDGHGPNGHLASKFCRDFFINNMVNYARVINANKKINTSEGIYNELKNTNFLFIHELFNQADRELAAQQQFSCYNSGTTCNIVFQFNKHLVCFSVGDSRGILVYDNGNFTNQGILPLSTDHKPDLPGELERIQMCGGEVETLKDYFGNKLGPPRVFKFGETYPGLAMSRSLGDFQAKECGVICTPQVIEYDINNTTKYMVICSDGVWEFISNEQVRDLCNSHYPRNDVYGFCSELIKFATSLWTSINIPRDDITVVGVFF